jgi:hypothetical protein
MPDFRITFGMRYAHEPHPKAGLLDFTPTPDGYVVIEAEDEFTARMAAFAFLGKAWAFIYAEPFEDWSDRFPRGELARFKAPDLLAGAS